METLTQISEILVLHDGREDRDGDFYAVEFGMWTTSRAIVVSNYDDPDEVLYFSRWNRRDRTSRLVAGWVERLTELERTGAAVILADERPISVEHLHRTLIGMGRDAANFIY